MNDGTETERVAATGQWVAEVPGPARRQRLAVVGAHLSGMALNHELTSRYAEYLKTTATAPEYRLYALSGGPPDRPGLVRVGDRGVAIEVEIWALPTAAFGDFVSAVPTPLCIGTLRLVDGATVLGFLCEGIAVEGARDISMFGGWRAYLASIEPPREQR